jgi:hypothetical protein
VGRTIDDDPNENGRIAIEVREWARMSFESIAASMSLERAHHISMHARVVPDDEHQPTVRRNDCAELRKLRQACTPIDPPLPLAANRREEGIGRVVVRRCFPALVQDT